MVNEPYSIVEPTAFTDQVAHYFGPDLKYWDTLRDKLELNWASAAPSLRGSVTVTSGLRVKLEIDPLTKCVIYKELV